MEFKKYRVDISYNKHKSVYVAFNRFYDMMCEGQTKDDAFRYLIEMISNEYNDDPVMFYIKENYIKDGYFK